MMENVRATNPKTGMSMQELRASPDHPDDDIRGQVHGETIIKDGKYAKRGEVMTVAKQYESDKGYVRWVRSHINSKSSMEMQKLRIYIFQRDAVKKERLMRERARVMGTHGPAWPDTVMSGPPSSCWSHACRRQQPAAAAWCADLWNSRRRSWTTGRTW